MTTLSVRLPDSLHKRLKELARQDGVSVNQFITTAVAEKLSAIATVDYLEQRAAKGSRKRFRKALSKVPDVPPDEQDAFPAK
jgi:predicted transcriptional regulator